MFTKIEMKQFHTVSKALGHPVRVQIIKILKEKGACVCGDINLELDVVPSTASEHLKILKNAGLICGEVQGVKRCYCLNEKTFKDYKGLVDRI